MAKPLRVTIKKIFHGYASIRSLDVEKAKRFKRPIQVIFRKDPIMIIPVECLEFGYKNDDVFHSKHGTEDYYLIDFDVKTYQIFKEIPQDLFSWNLDTSLAHI